MAFQLITTEETSLTQVKAPTLPLAPIEYHQQYQDQLNNILRLYFNQIDALISQFQIGAVYLVADLPTAAVASVGARAFVTNSSVTTFNTIVAGGGSAKVPVFFDGTNWRVG